MKGYKTATYSSKNGDVVCYLIDGEYYLTTKDVAKYLNLSAPRISVLIKEMEQNGEIINKTKLSLSTKPTTLYDLQTVFMLSKRVGNFSVFEFKEWIEKQKNNLPETSDDNYKIVRFVQDKIDIEVRLTLEDDNAWLTRDEMALMFDRSKSVISRHINSIFEEKEVSDDKSNVHFLQLPFSDKPVELFGIDVILAVGYRVHSQNGIAFRRWATDIIKKYHKMTNEKSSGNSFLDVINNILIINNKVDSLENRVLRLEENRIEHISDLIIKDGQIFDGMALLQELCSSAEHSITLIDPYLDTFALNILKSKIISVVITAITSSYSLLSQRDVDLFNEQYGGLKVVKNDSFHDRYLFIDDKIIYHLGTSLNYIGKKISQISEVMNEDTKEFLLSKILSLSTKKNDSAD